MDVTQSSHVTNALILDEIKLESSKFKKLITEVNKVIVGQQEVIDFILIAILCNGHILLEGVPGVAKTTMIKAITKALGFSFKRIQFTPDLLPADLLGTLIYNPKTQEFETKKGPIFAQLILADEINRASAKVQSALLECMQEQQVTIGSTTHPLDKPFLVFATQNPLEQEGTYRLPEAQVDRFMFKLQVDYPSMHQEKEILNSARNFVNIEQVLTLKELQAMHKLLDKIHIDEKIVDYIVTLISATRYPENFKLNDIKSFIQSGVSPRATLALYQAARARAFLKERTFVTPDDVKAVCPAIFRHRIGLTYEAEAENITQDAITKKIIATIPTP